MYVNSLVFCLFRSAVVDQSQPGGGTCMTIIAHGRSCPSICQIKANQEGGLACLSSRMVALLLRFIKTKQFRPAGCERTGDQSHR